MDEPPTPDSAGAAAVVPEVDLAEELTILPVADPIAVLPPPAAPSGRLPLTLWAVNFLAVVLPLLSLGAVIAFFWGWGFRWTDLGILLGAYTLTALGITVGFHRLFTHRSFETYRVVQVIFAILGSMTVQGPLLKWVALHRRHHQFSDRPGDPHSPHLHGAGVWGVLRGLWHAHLGWVFQPDPPDLDRYIKDLRQSRLLRRLRRAVPTVGRPGPGASGSARRCHHAKLVGSLDRLGVGRAGARLPGPPRHLERQLDLPPLGLPALPQRRREPEQLRCRRAGHGGGVPPHPPHLPNLGAARTALVAD